MIPLRLKLSGFLSYRAPVEVDFTGFNMACISGQNGAGKSSLLDAITWALFGQARKPGDALIHAASPAAEVIFTFEYEGNQYRIQRLLPRAKTTTLEFQLRDDDRWRPLTEKSVRATEERIRAILRLDYETFVNASFFLQGKADQFTQQRPGDRKRILASILGLDQWEIYRERASARRKELERRLDALDGRLDGINQELQEESARKTRLSELESQLKDLENNRKTQETALDQIKKMSARLEQERQLTQTLAEALKRARRDIAALEARQSAKQAERNAQAGLLARAAAIEAAYSGWQAARATLETFESAAAQFHQHEKRRQPFLDEIQREKAALQQEQKSLRLQQTQVNQQSAQTEALRQEIEKNQQALQAASENLRLREELRARLETTRQRQAALKAENNSLRAQMTPLQKRLENLQTTEAGNCPLCGQELSAEHRAATLAQLSSEGKALGDHFRANTEENETLTKQATDLEAQSAPLQNAESEQTRLTAQQSAAQQRLQAASQAAAEWQSGGAPRLQAVENLLTGDNFAAAARSQIEKINAELTALGYAADAHEAARHAEQTGRASESDFRHLEAARAALTPLEDEIQSIQTQLATLNGELAGQEDAYTQAALRLAESERQTPDLRASERAFFEIKERENALHQEVGMARQRVAVLTTLRAQKTTLQAEREIQALEIGRHKMLERAFGKDGVPALLIEQALPQIEEKANELLNRLSGGAMSVRFETQAAYKDKKRDDLKETLDIVISDPAGTRDYEMFSGGEAFRVNFAIRLALSEILARRTGARLQTLVIDEGFGSQDAQGVQRLIEAINAVRGDFAKILIITHLDELKDAFSHRIEVEKSANGSQVKVI